MTSDDRFASKAEKYAKYRLDYAPEAIRYVLDTVSLAVDSVVADVGSGTGMLTKHFLDAAGRIYAVEPSTPMRRIAEKTLAEHPSFRSVAGPSHATTLADHCVDLILVGQAAHWFDAEPTREEFLRILKPGGWLAVLRYRGTDENRVAALRRLRTEENGCDTREMKPPALSFWFGSGRFEEQSFEHSHRQGWEGFLGGIVSSSWAPDETHPLYPRFEHALRGVFERFASDGQIIIGLATSVAVGQPR